MKVTFVTAKELDPFTAQALNLRFYAFLHVLAEKEGLDLERVITDARSIMEKADIQQEG